MKNFFALPASFFRWWFGELAALLPGVLREGLRGGEKLLLDMGTTPPQLYRLRGRKAVPLASSKEASAKAKAAATLALARRELVTRQAQLPLAAEENLREVVGFEMDRLTPFSREEVYYACRVAGRDAKNGRLSVDIMLAPRRKVDGLLEELRGQELTVTRVDIAADEPGRPLGVNLLPEAPSPAPSRVARALAGALTATVAVLLFLALQVPLERKADYAAALSARVTEERARVAELRKLEEEIATLQKPDASLTDLKRQDLLTLALVDQVTRLLPDDSWLSQLSLDGNRLSLSGFSPNSSKLITTFEQSPRFSETVFRAPVTQDPRLGLERFSLSLRVEPAGGGQ
ncbi:PilN domain-containing protein [Pelagibius sp. CAU 1746]|uniref:PilN domain-containing protein n=1 Tax=Pelagibius sp. CAU 1746 TaxID=3140370 RepID=UPI00325B8D2B